MVYTPDVRVFIALNEKELRKIVTYLCNKFGENSPDDIFQEANFKLLSQRIIEDKFDPKKSDCLYSYIYTTVKNIILSKKREEAKMKRIEIPWASWEEDSRDEVEYAISSDLLEVDYKIQCEDIAYNETLDTDFDEFEDFLLKNNKYNKIWNLKKSRGAKKGQSNSEFSVAVIWSYLRMDYTYKQIADIYGVSAKFIFDTVDFIKRAFAVYNKVDLNAK